jgi:hypothetical protein
MGIDFTKPNPLRRGRPKVFDEPTKKVLLEVPESMYEALTEDARRRGISRNALIREFCTRGMRGSVPA